MKEEATRLYMIFGLQAPLVTKEILAAIETTTGHCTLALLDRQEVQSDKDYWEGVQDILLKKSMTAFEV